VDNEGWKSNMLPTYLANIVAHAQYEESDAERIHAAREERTLMMDLMLDDAGIESKLLR
jgi:hypothetical protein